MALDRPPAPRCRLHRPRTVRRGRPARVEALPGHSDPVDRLRVAAVAAAVTDPLRFDLSEEAVLAPRAS
ncbi:citrate synthase [Streptomyces sp. Amel2xC10]|nr:citrate synthase [Streptomyces sp. Amel2xC10]